jgi:hypothetical protein
LRRFGALVVAILLDQQSCNKPNQKRTKPFVWFGLDQKSAGAGRFGAIAE